MLRVISFYEISIRKVEVKHESPENVDYIILFVCVFLIGSLIIFRLLKFKVFDPKQIRRDILEQLTFP